jgi:hypothetical protein
MAGSSPSAHRQPKRSLSSGDDAPFGGALVAAMGCKVGARTALNRCSDPGPPEMGRSPDCGSGDQCSPDPGSRPKDPLEEGPPLLIPGWGRR